MSELRFEIPDELVDRIARRVVELLDPNRQAPYLNVEQAAAYLAAPASRVYELVERRRLRVHRDGRRLLFTHADLDAILRVQDPEPGCHPVATQPTNGSSKRDAKGRTDA
ncbi:MAG: excisionase family DNA-binding protein [Thermoanaerobaculia bacterium]